MNTNDVLKLSVEEIAEQVIEANGVKKMLIECILDGNFDEEQFDKLVEVNEYILSKSVNQKVKYCDLTLSIIRSKKMWSQQEFRLVNLLSLANNILGDTEYYRARVRELIVCLHEKDVLISVEDANNSFVVSEKKERRMISALIKSTFPGISSKKIQQRM